MFMLKPLKITSTWFLSRPTIVQKKSLKNCLFLSSVPVAAVDFFYGELTILYPLIGLLISFPSVVFVYTFSYFPGPLC